MFVYLLFQSGDISRGVGVMGCVLQCTVCLLAFVRLCCSFVHAPLGESPLLPAALLIRSPLFPRKRRVRELGSGGGPPLLGS